MFFDSKVDNGGLGGYLRGVVRVTQLGGDVEAEVIVILYLLVSKTQDGRSACITRVGNESKTLSNSEISQI